MHRIKLHRIRSGHQQSVPAEQIPAPAGLDAENEITKMQDVIHLHRGTHADVLRSADPTQRPRSARVQTTIDGAQQMEQYWFVRNCSLFRKLAPDQLARLERRAQVRTFPRQSVIYLPRDGADNAFLLADGRVRISSTTMDGKSATLAFIEPGELFGEIGILQGGPREEVAEAVVTSTVVLLPVDELRQLMEQSATLTLGISRLMGFRRHRIERRLRSLLFCSNRDRMIHLLIELAETYGRKTNEGVQLTLRLSHQDFASIIGATRESVTMVLGELQNEGMVQLHRRAILIQRLEALARCVGVVPPRIGPVSVVDSQVKEFRADRSTEAE